MDAAGLNWYLRRVYSSVKVLKNWELISDWSFRLRESDNPAGIDKSVVESFSRLNEVNGGFFWIEFPPVLPTAWANLTVQKSPASACGRKKRKQFYYFHIPADVPTSLSGKPFFAPNSAGMFFCMSCQIHESIMIKSLYPRMSPERLHGSVMALNLNLLFHFPFGEATVGGRLDAPHLESSAPPAPSTQFLRVPIVLHLPRTSAKKREKHKKKELEKWPKGCYPVTIKLPFGKAARARINI